MLNTNKVMEFFDASTVTKPIHIIGCGAIGTHVAEQLIRMGCTDLHLWDFDTVEPHNITNQMFLHYDIGSKKTDALEGYLQLINPMVKPVLHSEGLKAPYTISGYVFLCVDNIDLRREIVNANIYNPNCVAFFDFRMRLTDAQHYAAVRTDQAQMKQLLDSMQFSHDEAKDATPRSACNVELSVIYTVKTITALGTSNFGKLIRGKHINTMVLIDMETPSILALPMEV